ncbi:MAG TPA: hypothetical protein VKX46_07800 [Ktedonobacteraceae bacterium]|nr:hypothetical protein [Ktedonobacteraceae bacterium]
MLIGSRTAEELTILLRKGYFANGKQRITMEEREGAPYPKIRLWDDWERRQSHLYASSLALVLELTRVDLSGWQWYASTEGSDPAAEP